MSQTKAQLIDNLVSPITGALGSASAPTFSFTADPNTGLYSPGADQVAISTNGTGRLFVDASGRVGIGDSTPRAPLSVRTEDSTFESIAIYATDSNITEINTFASNQTSLLSRTQITSAGTAIETVNASSRLKLGGIDNIQLFTAGSERLRITSAGLVGVGTSVPGYSVDVTSPSNSFGINTQPSTGTNRSGFRAANTSGTLLFGIDSSTGSTFGNATPYERAIYSSGAYPLRFYTNGSLRVTIDSSGRCGIGTTSPEGKLEVSAGNAEGLRLSSPSYLSTSQGPWIAFNGGPSAGWDLARVQGIRRGSNAEGALVFYTNNGGGAPGTISEKARIDEAGRLLVGTSTSRGVAAGLTGAIQLESATSFNGATFSIVNNSNDATGAYIALGKSRAGALGGVTIVQNNDVLGELRFTGADGGDLQTLGAQISAQVDGTPGANDLPTRLVFSTTADGAASPTERLRITSAGNVGIGVTGPTRQLHVNKTAIFDSNGDGTTTSPSLAIGSSGVGFSYIGGQQLAFITNSTERARIDSSGRLGIGTSVPSTRLHAAASVSTLPSAEDYTTAVGYFNNTYLNTTNGTTSYTVLRLRREGDGGVAYASAADFGIARYEAVGTNSRTRLDIKLGHAGTNTTDTTVMSLLSSGAVGIGTTSPGYALDVKTSAETAIRIDSGSSSNAILRFAQAGVNKAFIQYPNGGGLTFGPAGSEAARIDSSGRLLVGTSSTSSETTILVQGNNNGSTLDGTLRFARGTASPTADSSLGKLDFGDSGHTTAARIQVLRDGGTWTSGSSQPTRLVFSTTANGASSPTERMRITKDGNTNVSVGAIGQFTVSGSNNVARFEATSLSSRIITINQNADGDVVVFDKSNAAQGSISISGSTVSYNGAHLSRWSQLTSGAERIEILRGSVLSNLDEMCEWINPSKDAVLWKEGDELPEGVEVGDVKEPAELGGPQDNEQLNRMKVSDVEGDKNVSGVFQSWDDGDDTYTNDFYCAMTGDFIIRIAEGVIVERGDLLMSAGDGTAKPQDDDIIRSKTIAKVTSTNVSCTYEDGSYCVPCVLMAC